MKSKEIDFGSKDIISNLPEPLICQILSFLPTKESALTSLLSKKWRYLFALAPNLEFDEEGNRGNDEFVDRVLDLGGNSTINKFTLKCGFDVDSVRVIRWILNVLERSVSDLDLRVNMDNSNDLPSKIFVSKSLVRLRIESQNVSVVDVEDVYLPKLKTLYLDTLMLGKTDDCFHKVISGCHVLEELVLISVYNNIWIRPLSSKTLKRLTLHWIDYDQNPKCVSFDTPNLVYLEYSEYVAGKYPKVNFGSLVEASLNVQMTDEQSADKSYGDLVANAADFLMGVCNVQILHLSSKTLEVLTYCCESIPVFNNLIHLTINTCRRLSWESLSGWESLPTLLKNCPNLETLVFEGLNHKNTIKCGVVDGCLCRSSDDIPTCLSSSPVKILKILKFGEICYGDDGMEKQMELVKHFLETMPKLEQMILYYDTPLDEHVIEVSKQLQMLPRVASANCKIQGEYLFIGAAFFPRSNHQNHYPSYEDIPTCLSSSPVKILKILKFGFCNDVDGMEKQMELVKHFLETMPKLEQMILYYGTPIDEDVIEVFKQLQMLPKVASANCKIQVISNNLSLSSSLSTSGLIFFNGSFPV